METYIPVLWAIGGLVLILSEFWVSGFVIFFFGTGAIINAIITYFLPIRDNIPLQILLWAINSMLTLFLLRRFIAPLFAGKTIDPEKDTEGEGEKVLVVEDISSDKPGRIRYKGTFWTAITYDEEPIRKDSYAIILEKEGLKFIVSAADEPLFDKTQND
ncbi:NfeD family protein [Spirochaetia bacterium 38H-sp]|uniref:NfeD family protein n=1 Tax=Rarispira pelagica TaxID=3141764 RepID=A0ABU9U900_9SPIR